MSNSTLKILLKEYEQKRLESEIKLEKKLNDFYSNNPSISEINDKINRTSIEVSKTILLDKNSNKIKKLNVELDNFKNKKIVY